MPEETYNYSDDVFPFLAFMISKHPNEIKQIPVMGFFMNQKEVVELNIDMIIDALDPTERPDRFKPKVVGKISEVNDYDVLMRINTEKGVLTFFVGGHKKPVLNKESIERVLEIGLIDASMALNDYHLRTEQWMDEALSQFED